MSKKRHRNNFQLETQESEMTESIPTTQGVTYPEEVEAVDKLLSEQPETTEETKPESIPVDLGVEDKSVEPTSEVMKETVYKAPKEPVVKNVAEQKLVGKISYQALVDKINKDGDTADKVLVGVLEEYRKNMKPGLRIKPTDGIGQQYNLWRVIHNTIELSETQEKFRLRWNTILMFAKETKNDVFNEKYILRFGPLWGKTEPEYNAFGNMINLIKLTCDPETRAEELKLISLDKTLKYVFSEQGKAKVIRYYQG
jgi:hypothetical protein